MAAKQDERMSVSEHIDELRRRLVRSVIAFLAFAILAFIFKDFLVSVLFGPTSAEFPTNRFFAWMAEMTEVDALLINQNNPDLVNTQMSGQFKLHLKLAFVTSLILTIPYIVWQLWCFVLPALSQKIRKHTRALVFQVSFWFIFGVSFGYFIVSPLANNFLMNYELTPQITNMIDVNSYLSIVLGVSLACGLTFQLPLLIRLLALIGLISSTFLKKYRKVAVVAIMSLSAVITPPDVFSMLLVALPLYLLYEYSISMTRAIERKKAAAEARSTDEQPPVDGASKED